MICFWGYYDFSSSISSKLVEKVIKISSWWGPKDVTVENNNGLALVHLSSPLNGATPSNQNALSSPPIFRKNDCTVIGDVRVDNRKQLCELLKLELDLCSDLELILQLYFKFGQDCVKHVKGVFAFCIFDENKKSIFCGRDKIGVKPFNFYFKDRKFIFSSHRKSILAVDEVDKSADWKFIVSRLNRTMAVDDRSENLHIKKLLPAHSLLIKDNSISTNRYWNFNIEHEINYKNDGDYISNFLDLFKTSIKSRTTGSTKIGAHLSGGLDSSGITGVASNILSDLGKEIHTFSYVFPKDKPKKIPKNFYNYNHLVNGQIEFSNIEHAHLLPDPTIPDFKNRLEHEVLVSDGFSWSNNTNTEYEIQQKAQEREVGVMYSGFLGDEIITSFCRPYYLDYLAKNKYVKFFKSGKGKDAQLSKKFVLFGLHLMKKIGMETDENYWARFYQKNKNKNAFKNRSSLLESNLFSPSLIESNLDLKQALMERDEPEIHKTIPLSLKEYQRNHISRNWTNRRMEAENLSALNFGLEYRYPMADVDLLQFVLSLPMEQKWNPKMDRYLYRRAMEGYVHDPIRLGKKFTSALKPSALYVERNKDQSDQEFWEKTKQNNADYFLDTKKIDENLKYRREQGKFYKYAILSEMVMTNKIKI